MATESGTKDLAVVLGAAQVDPSAAPPLGRFDEIARRLKAEPWSFEFFQAVWLIERMRADSRPVGHFVSPQTEIVRFTVYPSIAFPASEIQDLNWESAMPRMMVNFMGFSGPSGVLPHVYTILIQERERNQDRTLREFLDLFHHRWISLFFRAWKKYRLPVRYSDPTNRDRLLQYLYSLVGLGTPHLRGRMDIEDQSLIYYAGLIGLETRSAGALEQILNDYFGVPARVEQFIGAWYPLGPEATCRFLEIDDPCEQLGLGVVVGDEVWDSQSRVRIRLGPLTMAQYDMFLPGRSGYARLRALTRFYSRDQLDFEVQLVLRREEVPYCSMDQEVSPVQLGWTTWVKTRKEFFRDPEDAVFSLQ